MAGTRRENNTLGIRLSLDEVSLEFTDNVSEVIDKGKNQFFPCFFFSFPGCQYTDEVIVLLFLLLVSSILLAGLTGFRGGSGI